MVSNSSKVSPWDEKLRIRATLTDLTEWSLQKVSMQFLHAQIVLTHVIQRTHVILISLVIHTCHNTPDMGDAKSVAVFIPSPTLVLVSWDSSAAAKILVTHFWNILHMNSRKDSYVRHINVLPKVRCKKKNTLLTWLLYYCWLLNQIFHVVLRSALEVQPFYCLCWSNFRKPVCDEEMLRPLQQMPLMCFWNLCPVQTPYGQNFPN